MYEAMDCDRDVGRVSGGKAGDGEDTARKKACSSELGVRPHLPRMAASMFSAWECLHSSQLESSSVKWTFHNAGTGIK